MAGLRIVDVRDDLLRKLGIEDAGSASTGMLADVLEAMNRAQQLLWLAGPDYFTRTHINLTLVAGTQTYDLADTVQSVLGPVRLPSGRSLTPLESRAELDNFGMQYLGQSNPTLDADEPVGYFVEHLNQSGDDPVKIRIHIVPPPDSENAGTAVVEGVSECTGFDLEDLDSEDKLPVAQQYVESLFLPLARKALTRSAYFSATDLLPRIDEDHALALELLRRAGGFPPVEARRERREVEA